MNSLKLGTDVKDSVTGFKGMLTQLQVEMDRRAFYLFQPRGLNPETGQPVDRFWLVRERITGGEEVEVDLPFECLGTPASDRATGFKGTIIALNIHVSGCVHVDIKPAGKVEKTGNAIDACNFDIHRIDCPALKKLSKKEIEVERQSKPSPEGTVQIQLGSHGQSQPRLHRLGSY